MKLNLPQWKCHKVVGAAKITGIAPDKDAPFGSSIGLGEHGSLHVDNAWGVKHKPQIGGYYVEYADGYSSYSPAEAFESGYTLLDGNEPGRAPKWPLPAASVKEGT